MNKYGIPEDELKKIRARDKTCAYCHKEMVRPRIGEDRRRWATIEHLNHLPPWNNPKTIVICCGSCNSSRGKQLLSDWFVTPYCIERNINEKTVSEPVRKYVRYIDFLNRCVWTFAKTMPGIPHEYIVRDKLSADDKKTFDAFNDYIQTNGYSATFGSNNYTYLTIGRHKYWIIENILNRVNI